MLRPEVMSIEPTVISVHKSALNGSRRSRARRAECIWFGLMLLALGFGQRRVSGLQDWPQWRGPTRDGVVPVDNVPVSWPAGFHQSWQMDVGEGYSSPIVSENRVFVQGRRDPEEVVSSIDLDSGRTRWSQHYSAPYEKNDYARQMAKGPHSTPLLLNKRLFTIGASGTFAAWESETGRPLWNKDFSKAVSGVKLFCGTAASPMVCNGWIIVQVGSDLGGGQILAVDPVTGTPKWEWHGPGPGYASPIAIQPEGHLQIVALTERSILGLDALNGNELWSIAFPDEWNENIVTPLWTGSQLIVSGPRQGTQAYALSQSDNTWRATQVWKSTEVAMYMSSPVFGDGLIYGLSAKKRGQFVALEGNSGITRWTSEGRAGDFASVQLTPSHVLFLTKDADLILALRGQTKFEPVRRYHFGGAGETWASPVLLGGSILIRQGKLLTRFNADS